MANDRLIVAMDMPNAIDGLKMAEQLGDAVSFYKIGLGMLTGGGLALAKRVEIPRHLRGQHCSAVGDLRVRRTLHVGWHDAQRKENQVQHRQLGLKYCAWRPKPLL